MVTQGRKARGVVAIAALLALSACSTNGSTTAPQVEKLKSSVDLVMASSEDLTRSITHYPVPVHDGVVELWGQIDADAPAGPFEVVALVNFKTLPVQVSGDTSLDNSGRAHFGLRLAGVPQGADLRFVIRLPGEKERGLFIPILRGQAEPGVGARAAIANCPEAKPETASNPAHFAGVAISPREDLAWKTSLTTADDAWLAASSPSVTGESVLVTLYTPSATDSMTTAIGCLTMPENPNATLQWVNLPYGGSGKYQGLLIPLDSAIPGQAAFFSGGDPGNIVAIS